MRNFENTAIIKYCLVCSEFIVNRETNGKKCRKNDVSSDKRLIFSFSLKKVTFMFELSVSPENDKSLLFTIAEWFSSRKSFWELDHPPAPKL